MKSQFTGLVNTNSDITDELVKRCKKGDHKAQLQVYKLYYRPVFSTCMQIVNDPARAEDLMHESFIEAFENINSYIGDISFLSWIKKFILGVTKNQIANPADQFSKSNGSEKKVSFTIHR
jgi:DNA-directed RNA polymerase specialized sigma24 family protein